MLLLDWKHFANEFLKVFRPGKGQHLGDENEHFWKWMFPLRNVREKPIISGDIGTIGQYAVQLQWREENVQAKAPEGMIIVQHMQHVILAVTAIMGQHNQLQPVTSLNEVTAIPADPRNPAQEAQDFARVALNSVAEDQVEQMLRKIEPRLRSIRSLQPYGVPLLYAGVDGIPERIPVFQLGHGFSRLLTVIAEIVASRKPVVLIDEIENGLHHSVLPDIWRGLLTACERSEVQIFATTHSWECVAAAHQAFSESLEYPLAVFRLEEKKGQINAIAYDRESLEFSIQEELEVR